MKIGINAVSVREGGSAVVFEKLLEQFTRLRPDLEYHVVVHSRLPDSKVFRHPSVVRHGMSWAESAPGVVAWYAAGLARWLSRQRMDVLFSETNYLPRAAPCPMVLLEQHAGYFCPDFHLDAPLSPPRKLAFAVKRGWIVRSVRAATRVLVQTETLATAIRAQCGVDRTVAVVPHGPGFLDELQPARATRDARRPLEVLYVTKYGVQKNFRVLIAAIARLRRAGIPVRGHLTLARHELGGRLPSGLLERVDGGVEFHGESGREALAALYRDADVFVFPSVCESFGFPFVEALAFGLPVLASDTSGNRELGADAAQYFAPSDADALAAMLRELHEQRSLLDAAAERSRVRARAFDWATTGRETLGHLLEVAGASRTERP